MYFLCPVYSAYIPLNLWRLPQMSRVIALLKKKTHDPSQWGLNFCKIHIFGEFEILSWGWYSHFTNTSFTHRVIYQLIFSDVYEIIKRHFVVLSVYTYKLVRIIWIPLWLRIVQIHPHCKKLIIQMLKLNRKRGMKIKGMKMTQYIAQLCSATRILVCFGTKRFGSNNPHCTMYIVLWALC